MVVLLLQGQKLHQDHDQKKEVMEEMVTIHQLVNQRKQQRRGWMAPRRQSSSDPPRESPATSEGLGPIVIGGHDQQSSDPPQEDENRSSSQGMIGRALSAISNMGRGSSSNERQIIRKNSIRRATISIRRE